VVQSLTHGVELRSLDLGLAIVLGAGLVNLVLGYYLSAPAATTTR